MWNRAMLALLQSLLIAGGAGAATVTQEQIQRAALFTERAETVRDGSVPIIGERLGRSRWLDDHRLAYEAIDGAHAVALIRSHRDFDMLILPGANHSIGEDRYTYRRIWDYFMRNLSPGEADVFSFAWPAALTKVGAPVDSRRPQ